MRKLKTTIVLFTILPAAILASISCAQTTEPHKKGKEASTTATDDLGNELKNLQGKVAELEAALASQHRERYGSNDGSSQPKESMKGMGKMGGMKGMSQDSGGSMPAMGMGMMGKGMGGMEMMAKMKGGKGMMGMMGMNPAMSSDSMAGMVMPSALPGFPGASHLYHIGQSGFFLDHSEHITLSSDQQKTLNEIKESALLATSTAERNIAEAEQDLWKLTASDKPDINKIEAKAKEIAQLQVSLRIAFIRSVGEAANVLTKEQRQALVGEEKN